MEEGVLDSPAGHRLTGAAAFLVLIATRFQSKWQWLLSSLATTVGGHGGLAHGGFWLLSYVPRESVTRLCAMHPTAAWSMHVWIACWLAWEPQPAAVGCLPLPLFALASGCPARVYKHARSESRGFGVMGRQPVDPKLWFPLATPTLWMSTPSCAVVHRCDYELADYTIGTSAFEIVIAPPCSGYEVLA